MKTRIHALFALAIALLLTSRISEPTRTGTAAPVSSPAPRKSAEAIETPDCDQLIAAGRIVSQETFRKMTQHLGGDEFTASGKKVIAIRNGDVHLSLNEGAYCQAVFPLDGLQIAPGDVITVTGRIKSATNMLGKSVADINLFEVEVFP